MIITNFISQQSESISDLSTFSNILLRSVPVDNHYVKLQIWDTAGQ